MQSRTIKFRAWDKSSKIMSEGLPLVWFISGDGTDMEFPKSDESLPLNDFREYLHDFELMQYTGLKDKNGKEIYEGDILERIGTMDNFTTTLTDTRKRELIVVELKTTTDNFGNSTFGFSMHTQGSYSERGHPATYEIIGNIYESPELLSPSK